MEIEQFEGTSIKVIGVGGAGGNAIEHMLKNGVQGVEFIAANTDAQALQRSSAAVRLPLGRNGLGAGARPERGHEAAMARRDDIREALAGANMVFITAGMGGGTGTGAAPVVAEVAREMGILTVGVVTKPFSFEGSKRMRAAEEGIAALSKQVDSLIVVLNDKLTEVLGEDADMADGFAAADDILKNAVGGIAEIITFPGLVNVDFEDVRTVMSEMGRAMMGAAVAAGPDRAMLAAQEAVASPLLEGIQLAGAKGVLVNITAAKTGLKMREVHQVMNVVRSCADEDAHIIFGAVYDDAMGDDMRVTVVATGLDEPERARLQLVEPAKTAAAVAAPGQATVLRRAGASMQAPVVARSHCIGEESTYDIPAFLRRRVSA